MDCTPRTTFAYPYIGCRSRRKISLERNAPCARLTPTPRAAISRHAAGVATCLPPFDGDEVWQQVFRFRQAVRISKDDRRRSEYLARHIPYVWDTRRGARSFQDVRSELAKFLAGKSAAESQAAAK